MKKTVIFFFAVLTIIACEKEGTDLNQEKQVSNFIYKGDTLQLTGYIDKTTREVYYYETDENNLLMEVFEKPTSSIQQFIGSDYLYLFDTSEELEMKIKEQLANLKKESSRLKLSGYTILDVYEHKDYGGASIRISNNWDWEEVNKAELWILHGTTNLKSKNFNDKISSWKIYSQTWAGFNGLPVVSFFEDAEFKGKCWNISVNPTRDNEGKNFFESDLSDNLMKWQGLKRIYWGDQISSIKYLYQ